MVNKELLSPCGLYCGLCGIHYASSRNDQGLKEKLARAYNDKPENIECGGCRSDRPYWFCRSCPVKSCANGKELEGCYQCGDFPCQTIEAFPIAEARAHMLRSIPQWRDLGTEEWIAAEKRLFSCAECGAEMFRGGRKCRECGAIKA